MATKNGISRRMVLAGAGGAAGATALGVIPALSAAADPGAVQGAGLINAPYTPGALTPGYSYRYYSGWQFENLTSDQQFSRSDGIFRFTGTSTGYAYINHNLPAGSVIHEIELYGVRSAVGSANLELWRTAGSTGTFATSLDTVTIPATIGQFTVKSTSTQNVTVTDDIVPFVYVATSPPTYIQFFGFRIGYTGPTQLYLLGTPVRAHDSRVANGGPGPIPGGTTRTISLASAIPASATGALMTVTLDNSSGSGFLSVFSAALASTTTSSLNWYQDGQVLANSVTSAVSGQSVKVFCGNGATNFLIDVLGYYQ